MTVSHRHLPILFLVFSLLFAACSAPAIQQPPPPSATEAPPQPSATHVPEPTPTALPTEAPEELVFTDGLERQLVLMQPAQKIVSLAPSNTEILFAIGASQQVIGRDAFSDYPTEASELPDVGGGWGELNNELIVSLQPDLVLAAQINTIEQVQTLEDFGLTVYYLPNPTDMDGLYANLREVAQLTGQEANAEELIAKLEARVAAVEEKIAPLSYRPLTFYELDSTDPNAPWTSGPGTFIDLLIDMAGGTNLGSSLEGAWVQVSVEDLIEKNPEIILLGDYIWGGVTPEDVVSRPGWDVIVAVEKEQVYPFDDNLVSRPGPRLVDGLEELARLLHPEVFE